MNLLRRVKCTWCAWHGMWRVIWCLRGWVGWILVRRHGSHMRVEHWRCLILIRRRRHAFGEWRERKNVKLFLPVLSSSSIGWESEKLDKCLNNTYKDQAEFDPPADAYLSRLTMECTTLAAPAWADETRHILRWRCKLCGISVFYKSSLGCSQSWRRPRWWSHQCRFSPS